MAEVNHLSALGPALSHAKPGQLTQKTAMTNSPKQEIPIDHRRDGTDFAEFKEGKTTLVPVAGKEAPNLAAEEDKSRSTYQVALGMAHGAFLTIKVDAGGNPTTSHPSKVIIERYEEQLRQRHTGEALNQNKGCS